MPYKNDLHIPGDTNPLGSIIYIIWILPIAKFDIVLYDYVVSNNIIWAKSYWTYCIVKILHYTDILDIPLSILPFMIAAHFSCLHTILYVQEVLSNFI